MVQAFKILFSGIAAVYAAAILFSCGMEEPPPIVQKSDTLVPTEISFNTTIMLSDSAVLKIKVITPKLMRFSDEENPYVEFPEGVRMEMYDSSGTLESVLTANYGVNYPEESRVIVKHDVVVTNNKNETLNTEKLTWLRKENRIFTEEYVKITTPDEIIFGDGLESNESFTKYRIKNIRGTISVEGDEEDEEYDDEF